MLTVNNLTGFGSGDVGADFYDGPWTRQLNPLRFKFNSIATTGATTNWSYIPNNGLQIIQDMKIISNKNIMTTPVTNPWSFQKHMNIRTLLNAPKFGFKPKATGSNNCFFDTTGHFLYLTYASIHSSIVQYYCNRAWDISTAVFKKSTLLPAYTEVIGFSWNGKIFYTRKKIGRYGDVCILKQFVLQTPWAVDTMEFLHGRGYRDADTGTAIDGNARYLLAGGIFLSPDGKSIFFIKDFFMAMAKLKVAHDIRTIGPVYGGIELRSLISRGYGSGGASYHPGSGSVRSFIKFSLDGKYCYFHTSNGYLILLNTY